MQAIILAAGMGKRLGALTHENTKCMVKVNGITLIDRIMSDLSQLNLTRIVIVIGYCGSKLQAYLGDSYNGTKIEYVHNTVYDKTNNIYSLYLAKDYLLDQDTLLLESDLIISSKALRSLRDDPYPNLALVDKFESWMDGTVLTIDQDNNITNFISKSFFRYHDIDSYYKTVNIYKFSKEFSRSHYVPFLEAYCQAMGNNEYYEQVLRVISILDNSALKAKLMDGERWYEIDDAADLDIACSMFAAPASLRLDLLNSRYGGFWRYPNLLDFCYLVNPYFPNERMIDELRSNMEILLREYPSGMRVNSLLAGKYFGINSSFAVVGNGAAELIKAFMEESLTDNTLIGITQPTFEEYPNRICADRVVSYCPAGDSFRYTADDLMSYFTNKGISTLLVINPDNPSGNYIPYNDLLRLIEWSALSGIRLVIDESFVDFASIDGATSSLLNNQILEANPHLVVVKSISKSYGVPGLRLGVLASGNIEMIKQLKQSVSIWNINSFAEFYMQIFGKYETEYHRACDRFVKERKRFVEQLQTVPFLRVIPSQANYFMCEVLSPFTSRTLAVELLDQHNILIKDCSTKSGVDNGLQYVRIAVRDNKDNDRLIEAMKNITSINKSEQ